MAVVAADPISREGAVSQLRRQPEVELREQSAPGTVALVVEARSTRTPSGGCAGSCAARGRGPPWWSARSRSASCWTWSSAGSAPSSGATRRPPGGWSPRCWPPRAATATCRRTCWGAC
ncbi:hypothetical protein ACFQVA_35635 [Actinomadura keratinilytica]